MSIKYFLITVFFSLFSLGVYINIQYINGFQVEKTTIAIKGYEIIEIWCHNSSKMSSSVTFKYKGNKYYVGLSSGICSKIEKGLIKPEFYYFKEKDVIFYKGQYLPLPYVYLTYIAAFFLPVFGFWVYRKELNNHYSKM